MTKLLATLEQADALAFARDLIVRFHHSGKVGSPFEAAESRAFVRKWLRVGLLTTRTQMILTELALAGEEDAQAILADVILEARNRREQLPTVIESYEIKLVAGKVQPAPNQGGRDKRNELTRNILIAMMVAAVAEQFRLKPTGRSARRRSACAVVADALDVINMKMNTKAIEKIWNVYGDSIPPRWFSSMGPLPIKRSEGYRPTFGRQQK
jgi:hypothetical protein